MKITIIGILLLVVVFACNLLIPSRELDKLRTNSNVYILKLGHELDDGAPYNRILLKSCVPMSFFCDTVEVWRGPDAGEIPNYPRDVYFETQDETIFIVIDDVKTELSQLIRSASK